MPEIIKKIDCLKRSLKSFKSAKEMFAFANIHVEKNRSSEFLKCWSAIEQASLQKPTPHKFLREYLWCVHVSGFSAACISSKYDSLLRAHRIEDSHGNFMEICTDNVVRDLSEVFTIFKNKVKAMAIQKTRSLILELGWDGFERRYSPRQPELLIGLPNIGPALSIHLARNMGNINLVKPDVHLTRLSNQYGFSSVADMCKDVSLEPLAKTDLVLWLASVDHGTK